MTKPKRPEDRLPKGRPTGYRPEYAEEARRLCAKMLATDEELARWFEVAVSTIYKWRLDHPDFSEACRVGKDESDDEIERSAARHMKGYYVEVEELDKFGVVHTLKKWIPGNAHAAMKWLAARRSKVYREQKDVHHSLNMDDAFLRFLDQMDAKAKLEQDRSCDYLSPAQVVETAEIQGVHVAIGNSEVTNGTQRMLSDLVDEVSSDAQLGGDERDDDGEPDQD